MKCSEIDKFSGLVLAASFIRGLIAHFQSSRMNEAAIWSSGNTQCSMSRIHCSSVDDPVCIGIISIGYWAIYFGWTPLDLQCAKKVSIYKSIYYFLHMLVIEICMYKYNAFRIASYSSDVKILFVAHVPSIPIHQSDEEKVGNVTSTIYNSIVCSSIPWSITQIHQILQ